jgi:hypothetical protein
MTVQQRAIGRPVPPYGMFPPIKHGAFNTHPETYVVFKLPHVQATKNPQAYQYDDVVDERIDQRDAGKDRLKALGNHIHPRP